jgi:hypothetical protein
MKAKAKANASCFVLNTVLRIRDVYPDPGSEFFPSRIPDPGSKGFRIPVRVRVKEFKYI